MRRGSGGGMGRGGGGLGGIARRSDGLGVEFYDMDESWLRCSMRIDVVWDMARGVGCLSTWVLGFCILWGDESFNSVAPRQRLCFCISAIHRSSWRPLWLDSGCGSLARMTTGTWYQQAHYSNRHRDQSAYLPYPFKTISQCGSPPSWKLSAAGSAEGRRKPAKSREPTPEPTYAMQHGVTGLFLQPTNTRRAIPPSPRSLPLSARLSCARVRIS
jgi:hypothetical protein